MTWYIYIPIIFSCCCSLYYNSIWLFCVPHPVSSISSINQCLTLYYMRTPLLYFIFLVVLIVPASGFSMKLRVAQYVVCKDFLFFFVILFSPLYILTPLYYECVPSHRVKINKRPSVRRREKIRRSGENKMNGLLFSSSLLRLLMCAADVHTHTQSTRIKRCVKWCKAFFSIYIRTAFYFYFCKE